MGKINKKLLQELREFQSMGYSDEQIKDLYLKEIGFSDAETSAAFDTVKFLEANKPDLLEKTLVGLGRGFTNFGEGVAQAGGLLGEKLGLLQEGVTDARTENSQKLRDFYNQTEVGQSGVGKASEFAGELLPSLAIPVPGGQIKGAVDVAKNIGKFAGVGAGFGGLQYVAPGQSRTDNIVQGGLLGGGFAGVLNAPNLVRGLRGRNVPKSQDVSDEEFALRVFKGKENEIAQELQPNRQILESADRLGFDEVPASVVSDNLQFREINQGLRSIPGSELAKQDLAFIQKTAAKADELIEDLGGVLDKSEFSARFEQNIGKTISNLEDASDKIYKSIASKIPDDTIVSADNVLSFINKRVKGFGSEKDLSPLEKKLLDRLSDSESPTYLRLDDYRKRIGDAKRGFGDPIFSKAPVGLLKSLEKEILADQQKIAQQFGQLETFNKARELVVKRKGLESNIVSLLGSEGTNSRRSLAQVMGTAIRKLDKGNFAQLEQTLSKIPPQYREEATVTALNDIFVGNNRQFKNLSISSFDDFWQGLKRFPKAREMLGRSLPKGAMQRLDDIGNIVRGIRRASKSNITTGRLLANPKRLDEIQPKLGKLFAAGRDASIAEPVTSLLGVPGLGTAGALIRGATQKTENTAKADKLLSSPTLQLAIKEEILKGPEKAKNLYNQMEKTKAFKEWLASIEPQTRERIKRIGFYAYMTSTN